MSTRISKPSNNAAPPRPKNRAAMFVVGAAILGAVAVAIWAGGNALISDESRPAVAQANAPEPEPAVARPQPASPEPDKELFADSMLAAEEEAAPEPREPEQTEEATRIPFELEQVADALSRVEVNENGDIVLNETAQSVLEQAFMDARATLDEQQLEELKAMIETGLGGQAGEQAARIADKFYRYSNAFREISDTLAVRGDPQSLRDDYEQIARLRRTHLGPELADQLYHREEQLARYTLEIMAIQADPELTPEQRAQKQEELRAQYADVVPDGDEPDGDSPSSGTAN